MSVTVEQATAWASQGDRKTAVLITLRKDGRAQSSDISYVVVDGVFTISLRLIAGEHPDWDEYRAAMVAEQRLVLRFSPDSAVGQING